MAESVFGRLRRVADQRREIQGEVLLYPSLDQEKPIDQALFKYLFDTQVVVEKQGQMDYHKYAAIVWHDLVVGKDQSVIFENDPKFKRFEGNLILGLQDIDMRKHRYSELVDSLGQLVTKYGQSIRKIAIWTTGDNLATGYQPAKVARSGIISAFSQAVKIHMGEGNEKMKDAVKTNEFILAKTAYIISDNKFEELNSYLNAQPGLVKLVVIEDSRNNIRKANVMVNQVNTKRAEGDKIDFVPLWTTYSREGIQAKEKAKREGRLDELEKEKQELHAIDSPWDLLDDKFETLFEGADILVDFDGVIGNNLTMREAQARVKYNTLVGAVMERSGIGLDQADRIILNNLAKLPKAT